MKYSRIYLIFLVSLVLFLLAYIFLFNPNRALLKSAFIRFFGNLKIKRDRPNNFKVKEKFNKHEDAEGVMSTCLFGDGGAYINSLLNPNLYKPEKWYVRIYLCPELLDKYKNEFLKRDYEIFVMEEPSEGLSGTVWRFLPLEEGVKFLSLDADDFANEGGCYHVPSKFLFEKWEKSRAPFVFFAASFCSPVMGGKWGSRYKIPGTTSLLEKYDFTRRGYDELFLRKHVYPVALRRGYFRLSKGLEGVIVKSLFEGYDGAESF